MLGEGELLFSPLSHLEVIGNPTFEKFDGKYVIVIRINVNINQKSQVIEEILGQRKQTIVAIAEGLQKEVKFDLKLISESAHTTTCLKEGLKSVKMLEPAWFNADSNFKEILGDLLSQKEKDIFYFVSQENSLKDNWNSEGGIIMIFVV